MIWAVIFGFPGLYLNDTSERPDVFLDKEVKFNPIWPGGGEGRGGKCPRLFQSLRTSLLF